MVSFPWGQSSALCVRVWGLQALLSSTGTEATALPKCGSPRGREVSVFICGRLGVISATSGFQVPGTTGNSPNILGLPAVASVSAGEN